MEKINNIILNGAANRPFALDVFFTENATQKPIIIFAHGFKGFKDWGHWGRIGEAFAEVGFVFVKFNFSHNGVTTDQALDFADLEAFGQNNYMKEIVDLGVVTDWLFEQKDIPETEIDRTKITVIGHSRGGPIAILKALRDARITSVITWASVYQLDYWHNDQLIEQWRKDGVWNILNGRTKQQMPLYFQLYENFIENKDWLDIQAALNQLNKPMLILHGSGDPAVPVFAAEQLHSWKKEAEMHIIEGANHVFGGSHPFTAQDLPEHSRILVEKCVHFLSENG